MSNPEFASILEKKGIIKDIYRAFSEPDPEKQKDLYDDIVDALLKTHIDLSRHSDTKGPIKALYNSLFDFKRLANLKKDNWKSENTLDGIKKKFLFSDVFERFVNETKTRLEQMLKEHPESNKRKNSKEKRLQAGNKINLRYVRDTMVPTAIKNFYDTDDNKELSPEEKEEKKIEIAHNLANMLSKSNMLDKGLKNIETIEQAEEFIDDWNNKINFIKSKNKEEPRFYEETDIYNYKFYKELNAFLQKINEVVKSNNTQDLPERINKVIKNIDYGNLNAIANNEADKQEKRIRDIINYEGTDEELRKSVPYLEKIKSRALGLLRQGLEDYFFFRAYKLIRKSKLDNKIKPEVEKEAKKAANNLLKNWFLPDIISFEDYRFFYNELNKREASLDMYQKWNLKLFKDKLIENKKNTPPKKVLSQEEGKQIFNLQRRIEVLLNSLKTTDENLKEQLQEIKYLVKLNEGQIKKNLLIKFLDNYEGKELKEEDIKKIIREIPFIFNSFKTTFNDKKATGKFKFPKLNNQDGFEEIIKISSLYDGVSKQIKREPGTEQYIWNPKDKQYEPYIRVMLKLYPKDKYEYVKYKAPLINSQLNDIYNSHKMPDALRPISHLKYSSRQLADEDGYTLALYDENKDLIDTANYKKAKYVKALK